VKNEHNALATTSASPVLPPQASAMASSIMAIPSATLPPCT
jgi:hypothetical protein